jgi:predicted  nucleic acid-binding Zn-ribbon protein
MNADLENIIVLQRLDSAAQAAERRLAEEADREKVLEARLAAARDAVAAAKERLTQNQAARREDEKTVALHTGRLSKFREQAMAVKTNVEFAAVQKEIEFAQTEIKAAEDKVLERMLEADDLTAVMKKAEAELSSETKKVDADRKAMAAEFAELKTSVERIHGERTTVVRSLTPQVMSTFERVAQRRNGIAVAEARDGICTICHVRLRPQVFNTVRRNEEIIQCDSCNRILYFVPIPAAAAPEAPAAGSGTLNHEP